jgi:hypothetical protein
MTSCATLLVGFGCANIIGLSDYEEASVSARGGSAGKGSGGSSGGAMGGGGSGTGGAGNTGGGNTGGGNTGGGSGSGGTSGAATGCDGVTPFAPNFEVLTSCLLRVSCDWIYPRFTISTCLSLDTQSVFLSELCTDGATSCEDIHDCIGRGYAEPDDCEGQLGWICTDDQKAINCRDPNSGLSIFRDCDLNGGLACASYFDSNGSVAADCVVPTTCTGTGTPNNCAGDYLYTCQGDVAYGQDCTYSGASCGFDESGAAACFYEPQPSCATPSTICSDDVIEYCSGSELYYFDCSSVGLTCDPDSADPFCIAPGCTELDVSGCVESCDETVLTLCYGGKPFPVDCRDYGFNTCIPDSHPTLGTLAYCGY